MDGPETNDPEALPAYTEQFLAELEPEALIELLVRDEDRVPRNVIDACAGHGAAMVAQLREVLERGSAWQDDAPSGEWWLTLHAAMILGLIPGEDAGLLLLEFMRRVAVERDEDMEDWLSGWWPALFRNKPESVVQALHGLCADRSFDWHVRSHAMEPIIAAAERRGSGQLDEALVWAAAIAADETEDWDLRLSVGSTLLDFVPAAHRPLLENLAERQSGLGAWFSKKNVEEAYLANEPRPQWHRFKDPWEFYRLGAIAKRQDRWAKEASEEEAAEEAAADEYAGLGDIVLPYVRETPKIGRNDPCPCGSGKKYKKCCLERADG